MRSLRPQAAGCALDDFARGERAGWDEGWREAVGNRKNRPLLLGVTVLTSFDLATLQQIGMEGSLESRVLALAQLAKDAGLDGVVTSAYEAPAVRRMFGPEFKILVPGVRPAAVPE